MTEGQLHILIAAHIRTVGTLIKGGLFFIPALYVSANAGLISTPYLEAYDFEHMASEIQDARRLGRPWHEITTWGKDES